MNSSISPAIQTTNLSRHFGDLRALKDVSLDIAAGTVFGFLGPNGAGKTTTIRLLLGLLEPTSGSARVLGFDTRTQADAIRQRCGALLEHNGLYERLSAEDNLDFYGRIWHMPKSDRKARIKELMNSMGLWDRRKEGVGTWSRGMKQKLAVARTIFHRPALVFLDEPTAGLDPIAAAQLRDDLASLTNKEGITIFLTTHNLSEAEKLCQRVAVINKGQLLAAGTLDELRHLRTEPPHLEIVGVGFSETLLKTLRKQPQVRNVTTSTDGLTIDLAPGASTAPLVSLLVQGGAQIEEARKSKASLEDLFLELVEKESQK